MPRQVSANEPFHVFPADGPDSAGSRLSPSARLSDTARIRQCAGKVKHLTMAEAVVIAKAMHKRKKAKFTAYECPHCSKPDKPMFHVGTERSREQARRRSERRRGA
jgi:hypothetical protein